MNTAQKFEEIESALDHAKAWLEESEQRGDPWVECAYAMLTAFQSMILGDMDWETCSEVKSRLERVYFGEVSQ